MAEEEQPKCPVDHSTREVWVQKAGVGEKENEITGSEQPKCPVDHDARKSWLQKVSLTPVVGKVAEAVEESLSTGCSSQELDLGKKIGVKLSNDNVELPTEREISSIPRTKENANWVYPSQKQFFEAMKRKKWEPDAKDMKVVVPIHNAVNERAWLHILDWEKRYNEDLVKKCGGIKLTSFKGDPKKLTPRAWFNSTILGYEKPFDRHDWVIDRCGTEIEYVIDFYSGSGKGPSFYLDVRPKVNNWEGFKLRFMRSVGLA